jgi:hypothetical protein
MMTKYRQRLPQLGDQLFLSDGRNRDHPDLSMKVSTCLILPPSTY